MTIRIESQRFQIIRAEAFDEFSEGGFELPRAEGRRVVLIELRGEVDRPGWLTIPSNDFRAEYLTSDGSASAPSVTFAAGDQPFRRPPPGSFFVANIRVEPGPLRLRILFALPAEVAQFKIVLPAPLMREEARKAS